MLKQVNQFFTVKVDLSKRVFGLDVFRSVAILLVVFGHSFAFLDRWRYVKVGNLNVYSAIEYFILGFDGVDVFFVLSGFLIGSIILRTYNKTAFSGKDIANFWKRRWLRTIPNYFFILIINILLGIVLFNNTSLWSSLKYFVFCQNLQSGGMQFFSESWSLSVEEWFYLTIPVLLWLTLKATHFGLSKKLVFIISLLIYLTAISLYRFKSGISNFGDWNTYYRTAVVMRIDTIIFGVLAAWIKYYYASFWEEKRKTMFVAGLLILILNFYFGFLAEWHYKSVFFNTIYFSFVGLGFMLLLPLADYKRTSKAGFAYFFTLTSVISYSIYLTNYSIIYNSLHHFFKSVSGAGAMFSFILFWVITYLLSIALYKSIELPFLNYRDRKSDAE